MADAEHSAMDEDEIFEGLESKEDPTFYSIKRTTAYSGKTAEEEYPHHASRDEDDDEAPLIEREDLEDEPDQPIPMCFWLLVVMGFLCKGLNEALPALAYFYFCKDDLGKDPATTGSVNNLVKLVPWSIKPIYGLFTDAFPIYGQRRKPYIIAGFVISSVTWLLLATVVTDFWEASICLCLGSFATAFANVCVEAVTVECTAGLKFSQAATLQSWQWGSGMASSILGSVIGGYCLDATGNRGMFLISGIVPVFGLVAALFAHEPDFNESGAGFIDLCKEWWSQLQAAFNHRVTLHSLIFIFIYFATPTTGDASNYFYTNELHMSSKVLSTVQVFGSAAGLLGIFVYQKFLRGVAIRAMVLWGTILCTVLSLIGVLLYSRTNKKIGIPDDVFLVTDSTASVAISQAAVMPLFALAALLCPAKVEGTIFALFTATMNFGTLAGTQIGALMTWVFQVDSHNFKYMWILVLVASLMQLIPLLFLWLIPPGGTGDLETEKPKGTEEKQD